MDHDSSQMIILLRVAKTRIKHILRTGPFCKITEVPHDMNVISPMGLDA
jgi:hypothetical protein